MRTRAVLTGIAAAALLQGAAAIATATPSLRLQVTQRGDFVLIGNTLAHDCLSGTPAPVVGTLGSCGTDTADTGPDVPWRADDPTPGQAAANIGIPVSQARSTAKLVLPAGASVTHAYLYWAARTENSGADTAVTLDGPAGLSADIGAIGSATVNDAGNFYQSVADITPLVQLHGPGAYRVSGVDSIDYANASLPVLATGWWMVVFYELPSEPPRNLALFDGLDTIIDGASQTATLSGFLVPNAGFDAKLGVIAYDGDHTSTGDQLLWNGAALGDLVNPTDNFFNSSRSKLGIPVSIAGDLPQLKGEPHSMSGIDLDVVDITPFVSAGQTSATIDATTTGDAYLLGGFITSISVLKPDLSTSNKTVTDLNGGYLAPGDELEYTIEVHNTGEDASLDTILTDAVPKGVTYVPGSIKVTLGPNSGEKTDMVGDDQGEYDPGTNTIIVRLGDGADGVSGGSLPVGGSTTVTFRVLINADATGTISNQATITASGQQGSPSEEFPTDGNGGGPGNPPTEVLIDSDGDELSDGDETAAGTDPYDADSDDDGVLDGVEPSFDDDSDGDGLINALDPDSDNDGLLDGTEMGRGCDNPATDPAAKSCVPDGDGGKTITSPVDPDTDGGGVSDGSEDADGDGVLDPGETDPTVGHGGDDIQVTDSDGDGLSDSQETSIGTNPGDADSDDDGVVDGSEPNPSLDSDGDGLINALDADSDNDGLFDGTELGLGCDNTATNPEAGQCAPDGDKGVTTTSPVDPDTDNGGVSDGSEDSNLNGVLDPGETDPTEGHADDDVLVTDSDGDGLSDDLELGIGTDPTDADSDDDGVPDGSEPNPAGDADGDGLIDALDSDSDNDGLFDGTELGLDCSNPATSKGAGHCIPDADGGATTTSPIDPDTDDGGVSDGSEDSNLNGAVDPGETDPTTGHGGDDSNVLDNDGDGISDDLEEVIGSDPNDADSDDDGILDGNEPNPADDTDGDGLVNAMDPDSDNDGLFDGTEVGFNCGSPATDVAAGHCVDDADASTTTSPLNPDTDGGGVSDGSEDSNLNGAVDPGETDPTEGHGDDDAQVTDSDGDGLSDGLEETIGTNPNDADSDDDGVPDGLEPNPSDDTDGDGLTNGLDPDSDNDGLLDGTEMGRDCSNPNTEKAQCVADGDGGATTTDPLNPDTDHGGVKDGEEDADKDGVVDEGETDPNNQGDDGGSGDSSSASGSGGSTGGAGGNGPGAFGLLPDIFETGSCVCSVPAGNDRGDLGWVLAMAAAGAGLARRRQRR